MDFTQVNEVLGLASNAVGLTGKAASTITTLKGLFEKDKTKAPDSSEASKLLNELANELTLVNMTNVQISQTLKVFSQELHRRDEFEKEKARYELYKTTVGNLVYKLKAEVANGQPSHFICPVCLNKDKLVSFIQGEDDYRTCQTNNNHGFEFNRSTQYSNGHDEF